MSDEKQPEGHPLAPWLPPPSESEAEPEEKKPEAKMPPTIFARVGVTLTERAKQIKFK